MATTAVAGGLAGCSTEEFGSDGNDGNEKEKTEDDTEDSEATTTYRVPTAAFGFDYDFDVERLQIIHESGDTLPVSTLFVRGTFDGSATDGLWTDFENHTASGTVDGHTAVAAGDTVTILGVGPEYYISVVWEGVIDGETVTETLSADTGPDA